MMMILVFKIQYYQKINFSYKDYRKEMYSHENKVLVNMSNVVDSRIQGHVKIELVYSIYA